MPLDRRAAFQFGLILLAVPAQYLITKWMTSNQVQRNVALRSILNSAVTFHEKYFTWKSWQKWCFDVISKVHLHSKPSYGESDAPDGESPAVEVMKHDQPDGYFAGSPHPRVSRQENVKYRVGQVIRHKIHGYRGVIVGWDPKAKAPESWLQQMHPKDKKHWRDMPNYAILVDTRDREMPQVTYVPQENIEILSNTKVLHPGIDEYFEGFDGAQYLPRPHLRALYPHD
ncbi:uncharacterized protein LOC106175746 [Lingula anatina]|uniref:Uncharacterized protein LOC106172087 n=1 Tax=Lingula anatina TaxID=7574 RepID=A0A1S3JCT6_LINAN|nr:uncharacterized protein LOC106172087 [Lingula anatina]XP_013413329.1 uncharacterized protein LOC106175746 [Lingula anatina]|eukprot:XP_013408133.1 uncharacterized protein LOC106172087 [Lingula anatina]